MHEAGLHREKRAGRFLASVSIAGCPGKTSGNGILIPLKFASVSDADGASLKATVCVAERGEWSEPVHDPAVRSTRSGTGMNCQAQTAGGSCSPPESALFAPTDRLRTGSKLPMRQKTGRASAAASAVFSKLPMRQKTARTGLRRPACFSKLPMRQKTMPRKSIPVSVFSKLPMRQKTAFHSKPLHLAFSKLPMRQKTRLRRWWRFRRFSKLPMRQKTGKCVPCCV